MKRYRRSCERALAAGSSIAHLRSMLMRALTVSASDMPLRRKTLLLKSSVRLRPAGPALATRSAWAIAINVRAQRSASGCFCTSVPMKASPCGLDWSTMTASCPAAHDDALMSFGVSLQYVHASSGMLITSPSAGQRWIMRAVTRFTQSSIVWGSIVHLSDEISEEERSRMRSRSQSAGLCACWSV